MSIHRLFAVLALLGVLAGCSVASSSTPGPTSRTTVSGGSGEVPGMTLPTPTYSPVKGDFKIGIDVRSKSCVFVLQKVPGHSTYRRRPACTVAYRIRPDYSGLPVDGRWAITYSLRGGNHGPTVGRFTMTGQGPLADGVHTVITPSPTTRLVAQVVSVSRG